MSPRLEGKFYIVVVRPAMLHGIECLSVKNSYVQISEDDSKKRMYEQTKRDKIRNEDILDKVGVTSVVD